MKLGRCWRTCAYRQEPHFSNWRDRAYRRVAAYVSVVRIAGFFLLKMYAVVAMCGFLIRRIGGSPFCVLVLNGWQIAGGERGCGGSLLDLVGGTSGLCWVMAECGRMGSRLVPDEGSDGHEIFLQLSTTNFVVYGLKVSGIGIGPLGRCWVGWRSRPRFVGGEIISSLVPDTMIIFRSSQTATRYQIQVQVRVQHAR